MLFDAEINELFYQIVLVLSTIWSIITILIHLYLPDPIFLKMSTFAQISTQKESLSTVVWFT